MALIFLTILLTGDISTKCAIPRACPSFCGHPEKLRIGFVECDAANRHLPDHQLFAVHALIAVVDLILPALFQFQWRQRISEGLPAKTDHIHQTIVDAACAHGEHGGFFRLDGQQFVLSCRGRMRNANRPPPSRV